MNKPRFEVTKRPGVVQSSGDWFVRPSILISATDDDKIKHTNTFSKLFTDTIVAIDCD